MKYWLENIEEKTVQNETFRTVLFTAKHMQLTVMNVLPGSEIGLEVHPDVDQFLRVEQGVAEVWLGTSKDDVEKVGEMSADMATIVPAGTWHNFVNNGSEALKLYSLYTPPEHPDGTIHQTKAEADAAEAAEHGQS